MTQTNYRQVLTMLAIVFSGFWFLGCQTDGPEFVVGGDQRIFEGRLIPGEGGDIEFFALSRSGTVSIIATTIVGTRPVTGETIADPVLAVIVGTPTSSDNSVCQLTFAEVLGEGDSYAVYFQDGLYCISVDRNPGSPEGVEYDYVITMTGAFS